MLKEAEEAMALKLSSWFAVVGVLCLMIVYANMLIIQHQTTYI